MIAGNHDSFCMQQGLIKSAVAEAAWGSGDAHVQSTATRRPRPQAVGARGAPHLPFRIAAKPSPGTPWARRLQSASWEWGSPDLPACVVAQAVAQYDPSSSTQAQDPREGPSLAGRTAQGFLSGGLTRQAREGAERSRQGVPHEVPVTQAMTTKARRAPVHAVSTFPLWC